MVDVVLKYLGTLHMVCHHCNVLSVLTIMQESKPRLMQCAPSYFLFYLSMIQQGITMLCESHSFYLALQVQDSQYASQEHASCLKSAD